MKSWGIIGGGILGMTLAYRLAKSGNKVTLFEANSDVGGLTSSYQFEEITWDKFYHVILKSDTYLRSLLNEIGLENEIRWVETKTGFYSGGKLHSMSNVFEYLKFPPLSLIDKARLGITILYASMEKNWRKLEKISLEKWLRKWSGKNTYQKIWLPLLRAKLGDNYKEASAAFIWATIQRMYAARKAGLKKEMFGYIPGGYSLILKRFYEILINEGVLIKNNYKAKSIEQTEFGEINIEFLNGEKETFDKAILTFPSRYIPAVCTSLTQNEKMKHEEIKYLGVICVSLLLKKPLANYYITNITDDSFPFTGVIEMTALIDKSIYNGNSLIYLPKYLSSDDDEFMKSDDSIIKKYFGELLKMYPNLSADDLITANVSRARFVFALPTLSYSQNLPPVFSSIPNLFIVNSAHIVNGTLNVNETIKLGEETLEKIFAVTLNDDELIHANV